MSGLPTLLRKDFVVPPEGSSDKQKELIKNTVSIEYILRHISEMIPHGSGESIKKAPQKFGDKFIVLKANTGSGKSTVLPAALYENFFEFTRKGIIVTQPRILTALDIPSTIVPFNPNLILGKNIGYNTGPFKLPLQERGIVFSTIGVLTQQLIMDTDEDFMKKYQFIIIDEVHERDLDTDRCLYLIKKLITTNWKNPDCPVVILMSATFDETIFINYFEIPRDNYIQVVGATFPIECNYPEFSVMNYIKYASLKAQKIHLDNFADFAISKDCDIIIFVKDSGIGKKIAADMHLFNSHILTGSDKSIASYRDIVETDINKLHKTGGTIEKRYYVLPIVLDTQSFSQGGLEYQNLFSDLDIISTPLWQVNYVDGIPQIDTTTEPIKHVTASRRIIIATNLAETGVTIPTLKYCIDTGFQISSEFYPEFGCFALISKNISYGSAIQRKGRVGRKTPGFWYPCYTKDTFDALPRSHLASILTNDTTETLLSILIREKGVAIIQEYYADHIKDHEAFGLFQMHKLQLNLDSNWQSLKNSLKTNISAIDFIELPSIQSLNYSVEKLHILGFIDDNYDITPTGFFVNKFRFISLDSRKMIMAGYYYGANILDLITIAAFVQVSKRSVFGKKFKMVDALKGGEDFDFYNLVLIADDFVNCALIWNYIQKFINSKSDYITLEIIKEYCIELDILFAGFIKVIEIRDVIIENMIDIGLDPYYNALGLRNYNLNNILIKSLPEGLVEIKKIKQCVYEGYKCNLLANAKDNFYISQTKGVQIMVKNSLTKDYHLTEDSKPPKYIIVSSYTLSQKFSQQQFEFVSDGFVSVLDGFIEVDNKFYKN